VDRAVGVSDRTHPYLVERRPQAAIVTGGIGPVG
jgi:hypothetical protein